MAFATTVALSSSGLYALGTSGSGYRNESATATNYHPNLYLTFLHETNQRAARIAQIDSDNTLSRSQRALQMLGVQKEILSQLYNANHHGGHF